MPLLVESKQETQGVLREEGIDQPDTLDPPTALLGHKPRQQLWYCAGYEGRMDNIAKHGRCEALFFALQVLTDTSRAC